MGRGEGDVLSLLPSLATDRITEKEYTSPCARVFASSCVHVAGTGSAAYSVVLVPSRGEVEPQSQVYASGRQVSPPGQQVLTAAQGAPCRFDTRVPRQCSGCCSCSLGWMASVSKEGDFYEGAVGKLIWSVSRVVCNFLYIRKSSL